MFWDKEKEKTIEEILADVTYETALGSFDFSHCQTLTLDDLEELQACYAHWKDNTNDEGDFKWQKMERAYHLLSGPLIIAAWEQFPPAPITLKEALKVFHKETYDEPTSRDVPEQQSLNHDFGMLSRYGLSMIEDAQRLDAAYHALYQHAQPYQYSNDQPIEPPCLLRFKNVIAKEKAAGWVSPKVGKWEITNKEAHTVFGIEDVGKFEPFEITALFEELQARCTSVDDAEKLDLAYRWLFTLSCRYEKDFTVQIASPYAPVLAQKLAELAAPPVIEQEHTQEEVVEEPVLSSTMARPFVVKTRQKLPPAALPMDMTEKEARVFMKYGKAETIYEEELMLRYQKQKKEKLYANSQEDLKAAFQTLLKIAA